MASSSGDNTKSRKKRPPETGTLIGTRLQPSALDALDNWRRKQADIPSRPEAIRRLVEKALSQ
jgi:hypothetical protein